MTQHRSATTGVQHRAATLATRADTDGMTVSGIAVPFDRETELWPGLFESVAPDAIRADDGKLFFRHRDPIGLYTGAATTDGYAYEGRISDTAVGRDAATLVRDGVVDKASIGFEPVKWTETRDDAGIHIRHTEIRLREISLVPHPAYDDTTATTREETTMPDPAPSLPDIADLTREVETIRRAIATLDIRDRPAPADARSAGQLLRAAATGDDTAIATLNRAYTGGTTADDFGHPTWVADLTRLTEEANDLAGVFADAPLPETGMTLEFGQLKDNTITVNQQVKEGDTIPTGNLSVTTKTTPVLTYAGGTSLTIQEIKRAQAPLLDMHLRALALEAGKMAASELLAKVNTVIDMNIANLAAVETSAATGWAAWVSPIVAAVRRFKRLGLGLGGLLLPSAKWEEMAEWADADGRPMLTPQGTARDVGTFSATTLDGQLLTVPTRMVDGLDQAAFFNRAAIRHYKAPLVRLTNTEVFTLTEDFAVYQFGAVADEIPDAIIPVITS